MDVFNGQTFEDVIDKTDITIYPNPTKGQMVVKVEKLPSAARPAEGVKSGIQLFDLQGRLVFETFKLSTYTNVDITHAGAGTYVMRISVGGKTTEWKVVKN